MNPYIYPAAGTILNLHLQETTRRWLRYSFDFTPAFPASLYRSGSASGSYLRPRNGRHCPLAILMHGMGDRSLITLRLLAQALATDGIACATLRLAVHPSRMPETAARHFPTLTPEEWFEIYQTSVIETRQVIDWADSREELDGQRIAVLGISFGGFISAITMGVDRRIGAGIFIIAGGNSEKINRKGRLSSMLGTYRRPDAEYHQIQQSYSKYLTEVAEMGWENTSPPRQSFLADPMTFAHRLRGRPVLMINALWDEMIPKEAALDLWNESGRPDIRWFPAIHSTIWLWYPAIRRQISDFLGSAFGTQP